MENDHEKNGRRTKKTKMEDDLKKWKKTSKKIEDDLKKRKMEEWKTTSSNILKKTT